MRILHLLDIPWHSGLAHYALSLGRPARCRARDLDRRQAGFGPVDGGRGARTPRACPTPGSSLGAAGVSSPRADRCGSTLTPAALTPWPWLPPRAAAVVVRTRSDARPVRKRPGTGLLFRRTGRTIAAAEYIRQQYLDTVGLPPERVVTILQGVELPPVVPAPTGPPRVAIVGRLDPVKGHADFLRPRL